MDYENREPPEGINYSQDNPLRELLILLAGATALVVAAVFVLALAVGWLVRYIPFEAEQALAGRFADSVPVTAVTPESEAARARLQAMADRIAQLQGLPPDVKPVVHLLDDDLVNAFATVGGHLIVSRGILAKVPHENALVALMAHEIAHVKHRDPVVAFGRGVAVMAALAMIAGVSDSNPLVGHLQGAGLLTTLRFNRGQERAADEEALRTLQAWYGHTAGAADLFEMLGGEQEGQAPPEFMNTHPDTDKRVARMREALVPGELTPLPAEIPAWANKGEDDAAAP